MNAKGRMALRELSICSNVSFRLLTNAPGVPLSLALKSVASTESTTSGILWITWITELA